MKEQILAQGFCKLPSGTKWVSFDSTISDNLEETKSMLHKLDRSYNCITGDYSPIPDGNPTEIRFVKRIVTLEVLETATIKE